MSLDSDLWDAKEMARKAILQIATKHPESVDDLAGAIDALNTAWDKLTDRLVAQRLERDEEIVRLLNLLAERRK